MNNTSSPIWDFKPKIKDKEEDKFALTISILLLVIIILGGLFLFDIGAYLRGFYG